jgi:hypothetical protein
MIEYRFRVPSAAVFTLYSYSKALEYRFRVPIVDSVRACLGCHITASRIRNITHHRMTETSSRKNSVIAHATLKGVFTLGRFRSKNFAKRHCSSFRCYLVNIIQSWSN